MWEWIVDEGATTFSYCTGHSASSSLGTNVLRTPMSHDGDSALVPLLYAPLLSGRDRNSVVHVHGRF